MDVTINEIAGYDADLKWIIDDIHDKHIVKLFQLRDRVRYLLDKITADIKIKENWAKQK